MFRYKMVSKKHSFKAKAEALESNRMRNAESSFHKTFHTMSPFITILENIV